MIEIVDKVLEVPLFTEYGLLMGGAYTTRDTANGGRTADHMVAYLNLEQTPCNVRLNSACYTGDLFLDTRCDCHWQLEYALRYIAAHNQGLILYQMHHEGRANGVIGKLRSYKSAGVNQSAASRAYEGVGMTPDARDYNSATLILQDLGITSVNLITNNPDKSARLKAAGIQVIDTVPVRSGDPALSDFYNDKRTDYGHAV